MMPLLILLFAVHPPAMELSVTPGEHVSIPVRLVGHGNLRVEGSGVLDAQESLRISGSQAKRISARVRADSRAGTHESYLYFYEDSTDPVSVASAVKVTTHVRGEAQRSRIIPHSADVLSGPAWPLLAAVAVIALLVLAATSVRVSRR